MDDSLPSSISQPTAESTFWHRDKAPVLQRSVSELFVIFSEILSKYVTQTKKKDTII